MTCARTPRSAPPIATGVALLAALALALALTGCGVPGADQAGQRTVFVTVTPDAGAGGGSTGSGPTGSTVQGSPTTRDRVETGTGPRAAGTDSRQAGPGTVCRERNGTKVVVNTGRADCAQAVRIIDATPGMGVEAPPQIEGWKCGRYGGQGSQTSNGYNYRCDRGDSQVILQNSEIPTAENWQLDFPRGSSDGYFFSSPSGRFRCGLRSTGPYGGQGGAGCHGTYPESIKDTAGVGEGMTVDTAAIGTTGKPGEFYRSSDPGWLDHRADGYVTDPPVLDYGSALFYYGVVCRSERTGVTCEHEGHGFTASKSRARVW